MELQLSKLKKGKKGTVKTLVGGSYFQKKVSSIGIRIGKDIEIISIQPFMGPIVVNVDNMRIAIGRGMADKIMVEII